MEFGDMSMTNSNSGMNKNLILLKYNYLIVKKKGNNTDDKVGGRMRVELNFSPLICQL